MKKYITTIICLLLYLFMFGQASITGEIRPRSEFRQRYQKPISEENSPAFFINQRSRLNLSYISEKYDALLSVQDVRVWGDEKFNTYNASMALHEAWIRYKITKELSVKAGRQTIDLDNKRLMSAANWNQTSKKHDAVAFNYKHENFTIDFISAFNQSSEKLSSTDYSDGQGNYKYLSTLWINKKTKQFDATAFALIDGFEPATDTLYNRITYGAIVKYNLEKVMFTARCFGQGGENSNAQSVSAWLLNAEAELKLDKHKLIVGTEILSGNDLQNPDGKSHTFEMPYGAKHAFNGTMDYFKKSSETKNCGLTDCYLKWSCSISKTGKLGADIHWFSTTQTYSVVDEDYKKYLASECDILYKKSISKGINFECGYSFLKGSSTLQELKGGDAAKLNHWAYVMLTFKPVFL